jgi:hypothetical protein
MPAGRQQTISDQETSPLDRGSDRRELCRAGYQNGENIPGEALRILKRDYSGPISHLGACLEGW